MLAILDWRVSIIDSSLVPMMLVHDGSVVQVKVVGGGFIPVPLLI